MTIRVTIGVFSEGPVDLAAELVPDVLRQGALVLMAHCRHFAIPYGPDDCHCVELVEATDAERRDLRAAGFVLMKGL